MPKHETTLIYLLTTFPHFSMPLFFKFENIYLLSKKACKEFVKVRTDNHSSF